MRRYVLPLSGSSPATQLLSRLTRTTDTCKENISSDYISIVKLPSGGLSHSQALVNIPPVINITECLPSHSPIVPGVSCLESGHSTDHTDGLL